MKNIVVRRDEEEDCDDIPEAIVIGIEQNDDVDGYEEIWMDPERVPKVPKTELLITKYILLIMILTL